MIRPVTSLLFAGLMGVLCATTGARGDSVKMHIPEGGHYQMQLGEKTISDPAGKVHSKADVRNKVLVAIFSAPNMSQGDIQQKWADLLANNPKTKVDDAVVLALAEDMSQAGMFKGIARDSMKKDFTPDSRPILVLDETGDFFKRFGVPRGKTQILIYDKHGKLRDVEPDLSDEKTVTHRVKVISNELLAE